jgi:hypothetical protein
MTASTSDIAAQAQPDTGQEARARGVSANSTSHRSKESEQTLTAKPISLPRRIACYMRVSTDE